MESKKGHPGTVIVDTNDIHKELPRYRREAGFTLIELMVVMGLTAVLLSLGAFALRQYWFTQAIDKGGDRVVTQLRNAQQRAATESHPVVYGVRFVPGTGEWGVVQYDPRKTANKCTSETAQYFDGGVTVQSASFTGGGAVTTECQTLGASNRFVFFFARGSATPGSVTLVSDKVTQTRQIDVAGITGRVAQQ